jgi:FeS assembly SUF system regulator
VLRITKQTDYGIMLLARMAELPAGSLLSTAEAARWSGLSRAMVSKILKSLARGRLIDSHRGVAGGYSLARRPQETTVAGVIRALEGPIAVVECAVHEGQCQQEPICPARINWTRINHEIERALERIPISEMIGPTAKRLLPIGRPPRDGKNTEHR